MVVNKPVNRVLACLRGAEQSHVGWPAAKPSARMVQVLSIGTVWSGLVSRALVSRLASTEMRVFRARAEGRKVPEKVGLRTVRAMPTADVSP